jgi:hypothetical protein
MTHFIEATSPAAPIALSLAERGYLRGLKRGEAEVVIPASTCFRFFAHGCIEPVRRGLGITPRGRTALLLGRF